MKTEDQNQTTEPQHEAKMSVISWVAVINSLPNHRQKVMFATTNGDVHKAIYMDKLIDRYGDYNQVFISDDGGYYKADMGIVTFWCDVPKPPCN